LYSSHDAPVEVFVEKNEWFRKNPAFLDPSRFESMTVKPSESHCVEAILRGSSILDIPEVTGLHTKVMSGPDIQQCGPRVAVQAGVSIVGEIKGQSGSELEVVILQRVGDRLPEHVWLAESDEGSQYETGGQEHLILNEVMAEGKE
jgi:hypothetical protein